MHSSPEQLLALLALVLVLAPRVRARGPGLEHAPPLPPPPWAPGALLGFQLLLRFASSRLPALGPWPVPEGAADWAVLGVPLDTEGGESRDIRQTVRVL